YVFLDPLYMLLGAVDEIKEPGQLKVILTALTELRNEADCGVIVTHHLSDKSRSANKATKLMASTYLHAWYEAALFVEQDKAKVYQPEPHAQPTHGVHPHYTMQAPDVGKCFSDPAAQEHEDVNGRRSPAASKKATKLARYQALVAENPMWTE